MKIKLFILLLVACCSGLVITKKVNAININTSQCTYKKFRVTSYYSPVRKQNFYYKNNVEEERILNGHGIVGASGRNVFNGMIAAPSSYEFGTKIYFPGWGIGQVEDRGGAIVHQGERNQKYDRIDIRAGKGEEGLRRALSFGVQYLDAYVCPASAIPQKVGFDYDRFPSYDDFFERMIWVMNLDPGRNDKFVQVLQRYLASLGYLDRSSTTGKYGRLTKASVCMFQQRYMGLPSNHISCGRFGPQTRKALKTVVERKNIILSPLETTHTTIAEGEVLATPNPTLSGEELKKMTQQQQFHHYLFTNGEFANYKFHAPLMKGQATKTARILQRKLSWLGFYKKEEITGIYDNYTINAVYDFQIEQGIIDGTEDPSVFGFMGPSTRKVLNSL